MSTDTTPRDLGAEARPLLLAGAIALATLLVAFALVLGRHTLVENRVARREARAAALRAESAERGSLFVPRITPSEIAVDPFDPSWEKAPGITIKLNRQTDTMPILERATIDSAELRGATDGERIFWRLSWVDATPETNVDSGRFTDAAALQFPIDRGAPHTMGDDHHAVQILHWKALWQLDIDEHFQDVQDLHPNYWADLYWFAEGPVPYRVPDDFEDPASHQYFAAYSAGNPMADFFRKSPVEELAATGFGSLTPHSEAVTGGRGVWRDGRWQVVFVRPMRTDDPLDYQFWPGGTGQAGVAIWNGGDGNVGGRKHWGNWADFEVSP